jgi:hypothetical protein
MWKMPAILIPLVGFALPAQAATYYASPGGSGTACTEISPCSLDELLENRLVAGDIGIVNPGTYSGSTITVGNSGTAGNPITLRAENFAVECTDPVNDPDGCAIANIGSRSFVNRRIELPGDTHYWTIEGLQLRELACGGAPVANPNVGGIFRYGHLESSDNITFTLSRCDNWLVEHSYFHRTADLDNADYGIRLFYASTSTLRNLWFGSTWNHSISEKQGSTNILMERIVCEGFATQCIFLGQEGDDSSFSSSSPTQCTGVTLNDGSTGTIHDHTGHDITIRNVFGRRNSNAGSDGPHARSVFTIDNVRDVDIQSVFAYVGGIGTADSALDIRNAPATLPKGMCGIERGNISIRGMIVVASDTLNDYGCAIIASLGQNPATVTLENFVCHGADDNGDPG